MAQRALGTLDERRRSPGSQRLEVSSVHASGGNRPRLLRQPVPQDHQRRIARFRTQGCRAERTHAIRLGKAIKLPAHLGRDAAQNVSGRLLQ